MGAEIYILISFHIVNQYHVKTDFFFTKKQHDYKCDIDFIQQFNKEEFPKLLCLKYQNCINAFVTAG